MMALRSWMDREGVARRDVALGMGITEGHLRTLLNANRTARETQCQVAAAIMGGGLVEGAGEIRVAKKKPKSRDRPRKGKKKPAAEPEVTRAQKPNNLRPMTQFETKFVTDVATVWIEANLGASKEELVEVVRALSIGIRS